MASTPLRRRLFSALSLQGVALAVATTQELVLVPVYLWGWGTVLYRDWLVLMAAAEFLALLDLGLQTYFSNLFMARASSDDEQGYARAKGFALGAYLVLVGAGLSLLALLWLWLTPEQMGSALGLADSSNGFLLPLLGLWVLLRLPMGMLTGVYRARGETARAVFYEIMVTVARIAAVALPILSGAGPPVVAVTLVFTFATVSGLAWADQRRRYGERWPRPRIPDLSELKEALGTGMLYSLDALAVTASAQGMVLAISHLAADSLAVVLFTTARTVTGLARQVSVQLAVVVGVEQSREKGGGRHAKLLELHDFTLRLSGTVVGALSALILVLGEDLLALWTHERIPYQPLLFGLMLGVVMAGAPARAAAQMLMFTNRPRAPALSHAAAGAIALLLAAVMVPAWGAAGAASGLLVAELLAVTGGLGFAVARELGESWTRQLLRAGPALVISFLLGGALARLLYMWLGGAEWWRLIGVGGLWALLLALPALYLVLPAEQRARLRGR